MNIDILAGTEQQAVVAKALEAHIAGLTPQNAVNLAKAVLLALDEHEGVTEFGGDKTPGVLDDYGLTGQQEIRARALDSAAHLVGPMLGDVLGEAPYEAILNTAGDEWLRLAVNGARYIESGTVLPELADG